MTLLNACGFPERPATGVHTMKFQSLPIQYKIASTIPSDMHGEIHAAFETWNATLGKEVFKFAGIKILTEDQLDPAYTFGENVVLATQHDGLMPNEPKTNQGPLSRTYLKGVSAIMDADIYLFEFDKYFVKGDETYGDVYSLKSVVMHEAGHMLFGSEHSDDEESIMTATLYPKGHALEKLGLGYCDVEHFYELYGSL